MSPGESAAACPLAARPAVRRPRCDDIPVAPPALRPSAGSAARRPGPPPVLSFLRPGPKRSSGPEVCSDVYQTDRYSRLTQWCANTMCTVGGWSRLSTNCQR